MKRSYAIALVCLLFSIGCAHTPTEPGTHMLAVKDLPPVGVEHSTDHHPQEFQSTAHDSKIDPHLTDQSTHQPAAGHAKSESSPLEALTMLIEGNGRFMHGKSTHPSQELSRRASLAAGQKPQAIILSCSDSRVPPEILFDRGLGDLFVVRTAGEVADSVAIASIEYALEHLGAKLIVVMGHTSCGAVKAALTTPAGTTAGSQHLDTLVGMIRPSVLASPGDKSDTSLLTPVKANVDAVAKSLTAKSKIINHALEANDAKIVQGVYHLDTGKVDFWF